MVCHLNLTIASKYIQPLQVFKWRGFKKFWKSRGRLFESLSLYGEKVKNIDQLYGKNIDKTLTFAPTQLVYIKYSSWLVYKMCKSVFFAYPPLQVKRLSYNWPQVLIRGVLLCSANKERDACMRYTAVLNFSFLACEIVKVDPNNILQECFKP